MGWLEAFESDRVRSSLNGNYKGVAAEFEHGLGAQGVRLKGLTIGRLSHKEKGRVLEVQMLSWELGGRIGTWYANSWLMTVHL